MLALAAIALAAADASFTARLSAEGHAGNPDSPFDAASDLLGTGRQTGRGEALLRARYEGLTGATSLRFTVDGDAGAVGLPVVNELYYDSSIFGEHFTAGKKVLSWDVGFAFRPLDVVQREDRRALNAYALEGVPLLAWEHFGSDWALAVVWANPLRGQADDERDDEALAARLFRRVLSADVHLLARFSHRERLGAGLGLATAVGDAIEVHGSVYYQQRFDRLADPLAAQAGAPLALADPTRLEEHRDGLSALAGGSYTWESGFSLLVEAFHAGVAPSADELHAQRNLAAGQLALLGAADVSRAAVLGNVAWSARPFAAQPLLRDGAVARLGYKRDEFDCEADLLVAPGDRSWVASAAASYEFQRSKVEAGVRALGGPAGSIYRSVPERGILYLTWLLTL